jgi:hypothetical protein
MLYSVQRTPTYRARRRGPEPETGDVPGREYEPPCIEWVGRPRTGGTGRTIGVSPDAAGRLVAERCLADLNRAELVELAERLNVFRGKAAFGTDAQLVDALRASA